MYREDTKSRSFYKAEEMGRIRVETRILAGNLLWDKEGQLFLETVTEDRYALVLPQIITLTGTEEKVASDELNEQHIGMNVIARCFV